jgi:hypothetical protein
LTHEAKPVFIKKDQGCAVCALIHPLHLRLAMSDEFQIDIPASFMALYLPPGKIKPTLGLRALAARYELCEDLANLLTEKAANLQFTLGITEELVLAQCEAGLLTGPAVVSPEEAHWVVCRLAELLQWPMVQRARADE